MLEEIQKYFITGLGAVLLTKDKIEQITRRWADEVRMSAEDAERLADEIYRAGRPQWTAVETAIKDAVRRALATMDIGSRRELEELKVSVSDLQKRVDMLEDTRDDAAHS